TNARQLPARVPPLVVDGIAQLLDVLRDPLALRLVAGESIGHLTAQRGHREDPRNATEHRGAPSHPDGRNRARGAVASVPSETTNEKHRSSDFQEGKSRRDGYLASRSFSTAATNSGSVGS